MKNLKFRIWDKQYNKFLYQLPEKHHLDWERFDVQQFTGLTDKLGKEIYEGDIVKHSPPNISFHDKPIEVKWDNYAASWMFGKNSAPHYIDDYIEVIGNIWENPNLLK